MASSSSSRQPPTLDQNSFHYFPPLPTEVRLKIWSLNLPPPRLVPICFLSASIPNLHPRYLRGVTSNIPVPLNLHVCSESRHLALQTYSPAFNLVHYPPKIFFNFGRDSYRDEDRAWEGGGSEGDVVGSELACFNLPIWA